MNKLNTVPWWLGFSLLRIHPTFMFLDDAQRDPEPQADASDAFGGEEWFEDAGQGFLGIP
jgi:hypothetical protein